MSNLLNTSAGRSIMRQATIDNIRDRMRRWFKRHTTIAFEDWRIDGEFELATVIDSLNVAHDPEIYALNDLLNFLLAGDSTVADRTFYVSPTGSDVTGLGTVARPFRTMDFLEYSLPKKIEHEIRVILGAGTYNSFPDILLKETIVKGGGRIVIDASGNTYPIVESGFTINVAAGVGAPGPDGASLATDIQAVGVPAWTANEHSGNFLHFLDGNCAGQVFPIFANTIDTLRIGADWYGAGAGDTFNIVRCPALFDLAKKTIIQGCSSLLNISAETLLGLQDSPVGAYLLICGCEFRYANDISMAVSIEHINMFMSFVKITSTWDSDLSSIALNALNVDVNFNLLDASLFANPALTDWYVASWYVSTQNSTITDACWGTYLTNCGFSNLVTNHHILIQLTGNYGFLSTGMHSTGFCPIAYFFFQQFAPLSSFAVMHKNDLLTIFSIYFEDVNIPIILMDADMRIEWGQGTGITGVNAVQLYRGFCRVYVYNSANVTIAGTATVYWFQFTGAGGAWPAIGTSATDMHGCWVKTVS